ncbi:MAG: translation initiation factor IF-2 subunit alpha [Candidatus Saliniplasma sp.]
MADNDYEWPSDGELVIGHVKTVKDFGAFLELEEYGDKEGFIHISEISSGWVKRIKDYIREGEKRVCKVLNVDRRKGHIDLSLKQVNEHQKREKIQAWKNQKKAEKLLQIVAEGLDWDLDKCYDEFAIELSEEFGSLYQAFEETTIHPEILEEKGFKGDWVDMFIEVAKDNITPPYINITGYLELTSPNPDGIEDIKYALSVFEDTDETKIDVDYIASPKYRVNIRSDDYKKAEETFKNQAKKSIKRIEEKGGQGKFYREDKD